MQTTPCRAGRSAEKKKELMPPITQALLIANVVVYLLESQMGNVLFQWFALWPGAGSGLAVLPIFTPWQLVTYSFLHGGLTHLAFNMFALWMFGGELERVWGARRMAMAYFASVVSGGGVQLLVGGLFGPSGGSLVGGSARVVGGLLAFALGFPDPTIVPLFSPVTLPAPRFVVRYAVL